MFGGQPEVGAERVDGHQPLELRVPGLVDDALGLLAELAEISYRPIRVTGTPDIAVALTG
jgi:hypothetical protein